MEASALTSASRVGLLGRSPALLRLQRDERLVALIRARHDRAFEVLFDRYRARLLAYCRGMVGSTEDAEDVLQEVFANAHAAMLADGRAIQVRPWLYRIARNRCLNHVRRPVAEGRDSMDEHPHQNGTTTAERVQVREEFRALIADVGELPETQRSALLLREIEGLPYDEIAEAMGTTLPAVKSLLVRARLSLGEASQARQLTCDEVQLSLAEAAEGLAKVSGAQRRHIRGCETCRGLRSELRVTGRRLAMLAPPVGLLATARDFLFAKLGGGSSAGGGGAGGGIAGGTAAGGAGGSSAAIGTAATGLGASIGSAAATKAAAGLATAALLTAGVVEVRTIATDRADPVAPATTSAPEGGGAATEARHEGGHHHAREAAAPAAAAAKEPVAPAEEPAGPAAKAALSPTTDGGIAGSTAGAGGGATAGGNGTGSGGGVVVEPPPPPPPCTSALPATACRPAPPPLPPVAVPLR